VKIKLSNRLAAVASLVLPGQPAADIGTDYGYLPVFLVVEGICPFVVASDRAKAPLSRSRQLVELLGLDSSIDLRLGDGLNVLSPGEVKTVCIAGVGGNTICDILAEKSDVAEKVTRFVLQPQRNASILRRYLVAHGYKIVVEDLACDDGFYYEILAAEHGEMLLNENEADFGPLLLQNKHPLLDEYLALKKKDMERLIEGLTDIKTIEASKRRSDLILMVERINKIRKELS